jgi:hypothetical protein
MTATLVTHRNHATVVTGGCFTQGLGQRLLWVLLGDFFEIETNS